MIRKFENFGYLSNSILEEIDLGNTDTFKIKNRLYKSGDYICTSFMIDNREVIVSSMVIPDSDIRLVNSSRNYKTLNDFLNQFKINSDKFIYVGFGEYKDGVYNNFENVNDTTTLFTKMSTIVEIIREFIRFHGVDYVIFNSVDNDPKSGLNVEHNKRNKFYELFLTHNRIKFKKINHQFDINGEIISEFYLLDLK